MNRTKAHFDLLARIYDASIDEEHWPAVLDMTAPRVGAKGSALLSISLHQEYAYSCNIISTNYDRKVIDEYEQHYAKHEENHFKRVAQSKPLTVNYDQGWLDSPEEFSLRPDVIFLKNNLGIFHRCAIKLNDDQSWFDCLTFQYANSHQINNTGESDSIGLFLPHFSQAMKLSRAFRLLRARFNAVLGVLDKYMIGVLLVLPTMDVVLANKSAMESIESTGRIRILTNGKLTATSRHSEVASAVRRASISNDASSSLANSQILMEKENGKDNLLLEISPIRDTNAEIDSKFVGAIVTIFDSESSHTLDASCLKKPYELTHTELLVVGHYVKGKSYQEIAEIRSVSPETVKSQIRSVLQKTRSPNRISLVNLIVRIRPPVEARTAE